MGKKIRPKNLLNDSSDADIPNEGSKMGDEPQTTVIEDKNPALISTKILPADIKEKLENYDALEKNVKSLSEENSNLQKKLAEYIEKNNSNKNDDIEKLKAEIVQLNQRLELAQAKAKEEYEMKLENDRLKDENEKYLMKISELTFENANLTCQLDELSKSIQQTGKTHNQNKFGLGQPQERTRLSPSYRDAYDPYVNNGYGTW